MFSSFFGRQFKQPSPCPSRTDNSLANFGRLLCAASLGTSCRVYLSHLLRAAFFSVGLSSPASAFCSKYFRIAPWTLSHSHLVKTLRLRPRVLTIFFVLLLQNRSFVGVHRTLKSFLVISLQERKRRFFRIRSIVHFSWLQRSATHLFTFPVLMPIAAVSRENRTELKKASVISLFCFCENIVSFSYFKCSRAQRCVVFL